MVCVTMRLEIGPLTKQDAKKMAVNLAVKLSPELVKKINTLLASLWAKLTVKLTGMQTINPVAKLMTKQVIKVEVEQMSQRRIKPAKSKQIRLTGCKTQPMNSQLESKHFYAPWML